MSFDKERMAQLGWRMQKNFERQTGHDVPLYKCERCEDTGFIYGRKNGVTFATKCTCRLRKIFVDCDDDNVLRQLDQKLQRIETAYLNGKLMPPSKVAKIERREWEARQEAER